jgi:predicted aminopeptidase
MTVEEAGLQRWLAAQAAGPARSTAGSGKFETIEQFRQAREREHQFVELFAAGHARLAKLYATRLPPQMMRQKKIEALTAIGNDLRALERRLKVHYEVYDDWLAKGLNNAHLASVATYYDCVPGFERLLQEQAGNLPRFYDAARSLTKESRAERHRQLCAKPLATATGSPISAAEAK